MEKIKLRFPVIVEGKYDKNTLSGIFDAHILTTGGFSVFNSREKQQLLRRLGKNGVILLTDSDSGGKQIRSFLRGILPKEKIYNVYIPKVHGKERRKSAPGAEGLLGVEGMDREVLLRVLAPFAEDEGRAEFKKQEKAEMITKVDFFLAGLSGRENSSARRARLSESFGLPADMTANALLEALNLLSSRSEYLEAVKKLFFSDGEKQ